MFFPVLFFVHNCTNFTCYSSARFFCPLDFSLCSTECFHQRTSCLLSLLQSDLWNPRSRVRTRPKPSDFSGEKIHSMPSFGGEVKPSAPCRRFVACERTLRYTWKSESQAKLTGHFSPNSVLHWQRTLMSLDVERFWRWRAELKAVHKGPVP
jgi:hypothetical protein